MTYKTIKLIKKLDIDLVHTNTNSFQSVWHYYSMALREKVNLRIERIWTKKNWLNKLVLTFLIK